MTATPNLVRASSYAKIHGHGRQKVYRWIWSGKLRARVIDGVYFVEEDSPARA